MDVSSTIDDPEQKLRGRQNDEFRALKECFADQLVDLRRWKKLSKHAKKRTKERTWLPLELTVKVETKPESIASFDLHVKCNRKYPTCPPAIGFKNVRGIGRVLITKLHKQLKHEASSEDHIGQGCIALLILRAQQFLEDHYQDLELNNKSFYDQMVEQKQTCDKKAELNRRHQDEMDRLERERQVEEIRQKILRKRELYNESRRRRDSQNSTLDNEADESTYDFEGDLDADSTTTSLTDDGENINRLNELDEMTVDEETVVRNSRRSTFVGQPTIVSTEESVILEKSLLQSRVDLEYEVLEELGHGGFGTVYKVRNRVDSRLYALKKVKLNPDNETLNEKIMREVKLLSRLNHENVIRYYTAWNETEFRESNRSKTTFSSLGGDDSTISSKINQDSCVISPRNISNSSDDDTDDVYRTSYLINDKNVEKIDVGETTANYVVFEQSENNDELEIVESMKKALGPKLSDGESSDEDIDSTNGTIDRPKIHRWLYIQMELGQGTLREAIDRGLPKHKDRARRFFREILDGLCHIHRQGIIHRDLKPVNIFLDSMDRPKIGDFGLATTNLFIVTQSNCPGGPTAIKPNRMSLERLRLLASPEQSYSPIEIPNKSSERLRYIHCNHTDNIGTPLYMSPELSATNEKTRFAKVIYSHKVDVYSLGIIYFEMLYPFKTGHERVIILQEMRKKSIIMPKDVDMHLNKEDAELIKLLLTHDVATRPTTEKLLSSNLLPSIGLREREYQNIIKQVVQNRQARTHKHMLRLLFEQNDTYVDDFVFDFEDSDHTNQSLPRADAQNLLKDFNTRNYVLDQVKMRLEGLLRSRGFVNYVAPTLMPKYSAAKYYSKQQLEDVVMLMDKNSSILTLPYDLRLPFARSISRLNISYMNRFAIEKIFRQRQVLGYNPDHFWECCVDIVTPPSPPGFTPIASDGEILYIMAEVVKCLPVLLPLQPTIRINSIALVRALMLVSGISENAIDEVLNCISESMTVSLKRNPVLVHPNQATSSLISQSVQQTSALPPHVKDDLKKDLLASRLITNITAINNLICLMDIIGDTPAEVLSQVEHNLQSKGIKETKYMDQVRDALRSLDESVSYARGLGLDLPIRTSPGFVLYALRPIDFYSGMVCMLECKRHGKTKTRSMSIKKVTLAVGGRYDRLMQRFSNNRSEVLECIHGNDPSGEIGASDRETRPKVAVGVSFDVEKLARFVLEDYVERVNVADQSTTPSFQQLLQINLSYHPFTSTNSNQLTLRYWPLDLAICTLSNTKKTKSYLSVVSDMIRQLREVGLMCSEIEASDVTSFTLAGLTQLCTENRIPYIMVVKNQSNDASLDEDSTSRSQTTSFNQQQPTTPPTQHIPPTSPTRSAMNYTGYIATLYQLDKSRLREIKRIDLQNMISFLLKRQVGL